MTAKTQNFPPYTEMSPERKKLVDENTGLINFAVNKFYSHLGEEERLDAWQDGWFGLLRAAHKFNFDRNIRFSTYAVTWIRAFIQKGRGTAEGMEYRRAMARGERPPVRPLSLNATLQSDGEEEWSNLLPAETPDPSLSALTGSMVVSAVQEMRKYVLDEADNRIIDEVVSVILSGADMRITEIARTVGMKECTVRRRFKRLTTLAQEELDIAS